MSTLSLRPDDRGGLEKWSNSGIGYWGNHQQQVLNVLEPASMSPSFFYTSHMLQSQPMLPQLIRSAEQDSALSQASARAKMDTLHALNTNCLQHTLLQSSNSNSMADSSTSDDDCTAPEIHMNCISALGGGPVSPVMANVLDRCGSTSGASLVAQEDFLRMHHPAQTSPGGGPLSPCGVSVDSLHGADGCSTAAAGIKRRFKAGVTEKVSGRKMLSEQQCEKAQAVFDDRYSGYAEAPSSSAVGVSPVTSYNSSDPALVVPVAGAPFSQKRNAGGGSASGVDMDNIRAILFRHASHPVPSLEEIASSRPKRRNVRISKDPQSVAARHRRERISDRMRVLQRLVPGGTKMDTASMLDEAVHYVKFLKLQLQTLEQIGNNSNNCDAQGSFAQRQGVGDAQIGSLARRPLDLNCGAAFQAWPLNNNMNSKNNGLDQYDEEYGTLSMLL